MQELDVSAEGLFKAVINVHAYGPVYFYAYKEGYTTSRKVVRLEHQDADNNIGNIKISSLHGDLLYQQIRDADKMPKLSLYRDECLHDLDDKVGIDEISFFENIESLSFPRVNCTHQKSTTLLKARLSLNGENPGPSTFFGLTKLDSGEAVIFEPAPSERAPSPTDAILINEENSAPPIRND